MSDVQIQRIDKSNWKRACNIQIWQDQKRYLSEVSFCLARAYINPCQKPIEPFVVEKGSEIIGFFWITFTDSMETCILCGFRIDKRFQRLGYAKTALKKLRDHLDINNGECASIQLFVEADNGAAIRLFKEFGFKQVMDYDGKLLLLAYQIRNGTQIIKINENVLDDE